MEVRAGRCIHESLNVEATVANTAGAHRTRRSREEQSALHPHPSQLGGTSSDGGAVCLVFNLPLARCYLGLPPFTYSRCEQSSLCPTDLGMVWLEKMQRSSTWSLPWSLRLPFAGLLHAKEGVSLCILNSLHGAQHTFPEKRLFAADGSWQHQDLRYCHLGILLPFHCCLCWCNLSGQGR